jgi:membrane protease YdiL (CAAX protease family)
MNKLKGFFEHSGAGTMLLFFIGAWSLCTLLGLFTVAFFYPQTSTDIASLKILQLVQSFAMFVMPPFILAYFWSRKPIAFLQLNRSPKGIDTGIIVLFMVLIVPAINLLSQLNQQITFPESLSGLETWLRNYEKQTEQVVQELLHVSSVSALLFNILLIAVVPALGEELFFRSALQGIIQKWKGSTVAIWLAAIIFSAIHFQFFGFFPRLLLGAFFGYLLVWSGNLWIPILAHFINNAFAVVFYYLKHNGFTTLNIDTVGTGETLWLGILSLVIAVFGIFFIRKKLNFVSS